jgi:hypothetical protein
VLRSTIPRLLLISYGAQIECLRLEQNVDLNRYVNGKPATPANCLNKNTLRSATSSFFIESGEIAEFIIYNRALTTTERQDVEAYLAAKWKVYLPSGVRATGGTMVTYDYADPDGTHKYAAHIFTADGPFNVEQGGMVEVLLVGGGGPGGNNVGGGGGAGGTRHSSLTVTAGETINVDVGAGGAPWNNGAPSVFSTLTANGGGRGGSHLTEAGQSGGCGGGTANFNPGTGGIGNQGQNGGNTSGDEAGGGGGWLSAGSAGSVNNGKGGDGFNVSQYFPQFAPVLSSSYGSPAGWFAGGGMGGRAGTTPGTGGNGGGGGFGGTADWPISPYTIHNGVANTGGGGAGEIAPGHKTSRPPGSGGSGIVVVRYMYTPPPKGTLFLMR